MRKVDVFVKGPGSGRETAIRSLKAVGLEVGTISGRHAAAAQRVPSAQAASGLRRRRTRHPWLVTPVLTAAAAVARR